MMCEPLKLELKIFDKRIDITDAKCEFCKNKVRPEIMITRMYTSSKRYMDNGNFVTYWHCDNCGAVPAIVNGEVIDDPLDLMDIPIIRLNEEIFVSLRCLKSAVQGLLREIERNIKEWKETMEGEDETTQERLASRIDELEFCKDLVKKWLADVVGEDEER